MVRNTGRQHGQSVRIIGGRWRGRRIPVPPDGVRPTGDRIRETLFNWLAPHVAGARCLDLFAGTGVLGIEALSRGAAQVVFVEHDRPTAARLRTVLADLAAAGTEVLHADAHRADLASRGPFDIVFLDPPFAAADYADLCTLLAGSGGLAPAAFVYVEMSRDAGLPGLPAGWQVLREKTAGNVRYALLQSAALS